MRKLVGVVVGAALAGLVSTANAQSAQGTIEEIDPLTNTIQVDGKIYTMPEALTAGVSLEELKVGDKVDITYNPEEGSDEDDSYRAMMVEKIEE